jgi:hypothetical protein
MEKQVREKAIEFNQNSGCDSKPHSSDYRGARKIFDEIFHG